MPGQLKQLKRVCWGVRLHDVCGSQQKDPSSQKSASVDRSKSPASNPTPSLHPFNPPSRRLLAPNFLVQKLDSLVKMLFLKPYAPIYTLLYYSSFHFIFHYPYTTPMERGLQLQVPFKPCCRPNPGGLAEVWHIGNPASVE